MSDCRRRTGAHCNCSEELVALLTEKLTREDLSLLAGQHDDVVLDSVAEARDRAQRPGQPTFVRGPRRKVG